MVLSVDTQASMVLSGYSGFSGSRLGTQASVVLSGYSGFSSSLPGYIWVLRLQ